MDKEIKRRIKDMQSMTFGGKEYNVVSYIPTYEKWDYVQDIIARVLEKDEDLGIVFTVPYLYTMVDFMIVLPYFGIKLPEKDEDLIALRDSFGDINIDEMFTKDMDIMKRMFDECLSNYICYFETEHSLAYKAKLALDGLLVPGENLTGSINQATGFNEAMIDIMGQAMKNGKGDIRAFARKK
jgi:hypothetical protein